LQQADVRQASSMMRDIHFARILAFLVVGLIISRVIGSIVLPQYDDSFITMRYARNLATGVGFVFNPGERVLGDTCPGFGLLQALFFLLHLPMPSAILSLNIICDALTLSITTLILYRLFGQFTALAFGILFSINPIMSRICVGCMEMDLFLIGSIIAISLYCGERKYSAVMLASILYLIRPESVLLVGLFCLLELFGSRKINAIWFGMLSLGVVAVPLIWIYSYYGSIIAQSVVAKSGWSHNSYLTLLKELVFNDPLQIVLFPFAVWGIARSYRSDRFLRIVWVWLALYLLAYLAANAFVFSWYGEAIHYGVALAASIGICDLVKRIAPSRTGKLSVVWLSPAVLVAIVAVWYVILMKSGPSVVEAKVYRPLEAWFAEHPASQDSILAGDIGAIGYYSGAYIYDSDGLVWPEAKKYHTQVEMIARFKPKFLFLNLSSGIESEMSSPTVAATYMSVAFFSAHRSDFLQLPEKWTQDYVLLKRNN
jgi:hypothetical protein